jgi:hypothetical protein
MDAAKMIMFLKRFLDFSVRKVGFFYRVAIGSLPTSVWKMCFHFQNRLLQRVYFSWRNSCFILQCEIPESVSPSFSWSGDQIL